MNGGAQGTSTIWWTRHGLDILRSQAIRKDPLEPNSYFLVTNYETTKIQPGIAQCKPYPGLYKEG